MIAGKSVIAIIPARAGSKGLPGKNIRPLCGKPLIAWSIESARGSRYVDEVLVSTDGDDIARVAEQFGAAVPFRRPNELATDSATTLSAVQHALEHYRRLGRAFDVVVLLEPTSPLREESDIDRMLERLSNGWQSFDAVISLAAYFPYGVAYIVKTAVLIEEGTFYPRRSTYHLLQRYQSYEIDDLHDFLCVEAVMKHERGLT